VFLSVCVAACGRSGEYEEALKLFADMKKNGLQPDRVAYNAVFSALRIANKPREVSQNTA
jgi:pentatricopeptide repeat protein